MRVGRLDAVLKLLQLTLAQLVRKGTGEHACRQCDHADPRNSNYRRRNPPQRGDRIDVAITNRGQRRDGPPDGARDGAKLLTPLPHTFDEIEQHRRHIDERQRHGERGEKLRSRPLHRCAQHIKSRYEARNLDQSEQAEDAQRDQRNAPANHHHDQFRQKGQQVCDGIEARNVAKTTNKARIFRPETRNGDAQDIFDGKDDDDRNIEPVKYHLPFGNGQQGRLGLERQEQETRQNEADNDPVGNRDTGLTGFGHQLIMQPAIQPHASPPKNGSCCLAS